MKLFGVIMAARTTAIHRQFSLLLLLLLLMSTCLLTPRVTAFNSASAFAINSPATVTTTTSTLLAAFASPFANRRATTASTKSKSSSRWYRNTDHDDDVNENNGTGNAAAFAVAATSTLDQSSRSVADDKSWDWTTVDAVMRQWGRRRHSYSHAHHQSSPVVLTQHETPRVSMRGQKASAATAATTASTMTSLASTEKETTLHDLFPVLWVGSSSETGGGSSNDELGIMLTTVVGFGILGGLSACLVLVVATAAALERIMERSTSTTTSTSSSTTKASTLQKALATPHGSAFGKKQLALWHQVNNQLDWVQEQIQSNNDDDAPISVWLNTKTKQQLPLLSLPLLQRSKQPADTPKLQSSRRPLSRRANEATRRFFAAMDSQHVGSLNIHDVQRAVSFLQASSASSSSSPNRNDSASSHDIVTREFNARAKRSVSTTRTHSFMTNQHTNEKRLDFSDFVEILHLVRQHQLGLGLPN